MTLKDDVAQLITAAALTEEERQGVRRMVMSCKVHLEHLGCDVTRGHLLHAVEAAIGTALEARGEVD